MECFKYYLPISLPNGNEPLRTLAFTITDQVAGRIIGYNGHNIRKIRKIYDVDFKINGLKTDKDRQVVITGNDRFSVYQEVLKYMFG